MPSVHRFYPPSALFPPGWAALEEPELPSVLPIRSSDPLRIWPFTALLIFPLIGFFVLCLSFFFWETIQIKPLSYGVISL